MKEIMGENNISEKIGRLRGDMEGYELKVKPMVEVLSAMLSVFEEKIKIYPALAIKVGDNPFSERLSEKITVGIKCKLLHNFGHLDEGPSGGYFVYWLEEKIKGVSSWNFPKGTLCELLILYGKEKKLINWLSEIFETIEGFREVVIEGLRTYIETIFPIKTIRLGKTIYCKRDLKGEDRWIPSRIEIEEEPPTERGTSAIVMRIRDDQSNEWKANLYFYEPEGLINMINELTKGIGCLFKRTSLELGKQN